MNEEKIAKKFYESVELVRSGKEGAVYIAKSNGRGIYVYKNTLHPINAMKVWVEKGKGLEEYISYEGANAQHVGDFSMVLKNSSKLIFADVENKLHAYGWKDAVPNFKKIIVFVKTERLITIIFASAGKNAVTVIEQIVDASEEIATACLFDAPSHPATNSNECGGVIDEFFNR